jgi:oligopeptide/dipeptide ABC transporter ATP-binding protein
MLTVKDLKTSFYTEDGVVHAVDGVSFEIDHGETFALVGESGCGKSVTAHSIMRILPMPPARIEGGAVILDGQDLCALSERQMRAVRGSRISMIFQEPMTSLNPVFPIGEQIVEAILLHRKVTSQEARTVAIKLLDRVGIPEPAQRFSEYPHQLSGGMRQRVMIAMALSCKPELLIADEPTTALDVTIQAQILDLLKELQHSEGMSILLITHDLSVVAGTADKVAVMYASKIVEHTTVKKLFANPLHPYTRGLFRSIPKLGDHKKRLDAIPGTVPNPLHFPQGCTFHPRCRLSNKLAVQAHTLNATTTIEDDLGLRMVLQRCVQAPPPLTEVQPGHWCACWEWAQAGADLSLPEQERVI